MTPLQEKQRLIVTKCAVTLIVTKNINKKCKEREALI